MSNACISVAPRQAEPRSFTSLRIPAVLGTGFFETEGYYSTPGKVCQRFRANFPQKGGKPVSVAAPRGSARCRFRGPGWASLRAKNSACPTEDAAPFRLRPPCRDKWRVSMTGAFSCAILLILQALAKRPGGAAPESHAAGMTDEPAVSGATPPRPAPSWARRSAPGSARGCSSRAPGSAGRCPTASRRAG